MLDPQQEAQLFSLIMDGLDDLYDQRFGWNGEEHRGEMWLSRLLIAVATSLGGSPWESELLRIARELQTLVGSGLTPEALNDRALELTDHLRGALPYG